MTQLTLFIAQEEKTGVSGGANLFPNKKNQEEFSENKIYIYHNSDTSQKYRYE